MTARQIFPIDIQERWEISCQVVNIQQVILILLFLAYKENLVILASMVLTK